jgi:hypothetical protein
MILARLPAGSRFRAIEMPSYTGTLIRVTAGSALVELGGKPEVHDFETPERWVRIEASSKRRTVITKALAVNPAERYGSMTELANAFDSAMSTGVLGRLFRR